MKKTIIITIICTLLFAAGIQAGTSFKRYRKMVKKQHIGQIKEVWCSDTSYKAIENRGESIMVEKIIGTVLNNKKDGMIMNVNSKYNYISYRSVPGAKKGDTILTVCIYQPGNNYLDDVVARFDYIIDRAA